MEQVIRPEDETPGYADLDGERLVLGQMLIWPITVAWAESAGLRREDFFRTWHARCWQVMLDVAAQGRVPDVVAVRAHWSRSIRRDYPGDMDFGALTVGVPEPTRETLTTWVRHLRTLGLQRQAMRVSADLATALRGYAGTLVDGTLDAALKDLDDLRAQVSSAEGFEPAGLVAEMAAGRALQRDAVLSLGLHPDMDADLGAIAPGEVVGVMARPGVGKTLILCHLVEQLAQRGIGQMVFSAEMQAGEIARRLAQRLYQLRRHAIEAQLDEDRFDASAFLETFRGLRLDHTGGITVDEMRRRTAVVQRQQPTRVVLIDHLGRLGSDNPRTYDRVSEQARGIKDLAKALKVAVVLLIQVSREAGGVDGSRKLTLGSARESGVVEENLDYLVGVRRCDRAAWATPEQRQMWRDVLWLSVLKNRHGAVRDAEWGIQMDDYLRFTPAAVEAPPDEPRDRERGRR